MSLLDIVVLGAPILRAETVPVAKVTDDLRRLMDDMFETMYAAKGIGLAAPQVGRTERLAVIDVDDAPFAIVNPEFVLREGRISGEEGCLSIPDVYGDVERFGRVIVRGLDRDGKEIEVEGSDLLGRCLQHEIDHLHGRLFLDHLSYLKRKGAMKTWEAVKGEYPDFIRRLTSEDVAKHHNDEAL